MSTPGTSAPPSHDSARIEAFSGAVFAISAQGEVVELLILYSAGFVAVFGCLILLFLHAHRRREALGLGPLGIYDNRTLIRHYGIFVAMGLASIAIAASLVGVGYGGLAGWIYGLLGLVCAWHGKNRMRRRADLEARLALAEGGEQRS